MRLAYQIRQGKPYPLGISLTTGGIHVAVSIDCQKSCGIILYMKRREIRIPFPKEYAIGNFYAVEITNIELTEVSYQLFSDDKVYTDPYTFVLRGREKWGRFLKDKTILRGSLDTKEYDWEGDRTLQIPFHESIFYQAHLRGFTKTASSGVKERGTFQGAVRKIPYLKELGITGVCFLPIYEFDEILVNPAFVDYDEAILPYMDNSQKTWQYKVNYWGFSEEAFYFAPKSSYAYTEDARTECRDMVKAFHRAGIEVLMQMYFPQGIRQDFIREVIHFWVEEYHIDGFLVQGHRIPQMLLKQDPMLSKTKLIFENRGESAEEYGYEKEIPFQNNGFLNYEFMYNARRFLKGDGDMLKKMAVHFRENPRDCASVNLITAYHGFTLMDLISYERKHNEKNGEDNKDGSDYNYSWNCGYEGETRRKAILELRRKQYRNAVCLLLFSQGTPMIQAGDEFGGTHYGNNNAYCQDNATNWLDWSRLTKNRDIFRFMQAMIQLRREHPILHQQKALRMMDYIGCGYPDLSYHGEMAWYAEFANYNHHVGILYCGKYARKRYDVEDDFIYVVYNMHWIEHDFALPKLPAGMKWYVAADTSLQSVQEHKSVLLRRSTTRQLKVTLPPRSIWILVSCEEDPLDKNAKGNMESEETEL